MVKGGKRGGGGGGGGVSLPEDVSYWRETHFQDLGKLLWLLSKEMKQGHSTVRTHKITAFCTSFNADI